MGPLSGYVLVNGGDLLGGRGVDNADGVVTLICDKQGLGERCRCESSQQSQTEGDFLHAGG